MMIKRKNQQIEMRLITIEDFVPVNRFPLWHQFQKKNRGRDSGEYGIPLVSLS